MKRIYLTTLLLVLGVFGSFAQTRMATNKYGVIMQGQLHHEPAIERVAPMKVTAEELLGCPDSSVLGGEYQDDAAFTGFQSSDQGRPDLSTKFYQHFSGNYYKVTGVRFIGQFNYWDAENYGWYYCDDRAGIDSTGEMTKPVRFEISFYKEDKDGMPGECVYTKEFDLLGENTGVQLGDDEEGYQDLYAFTVSLGDTVKMESGYLSVSAVDMGDSPTCWFSVFTCSSSMDFGLIQYDGADFDYAMNPMIFCLNGNGDMAAQKSLKLSRVLAPTSGEKGKYATVQVELENAGAKPINDAVLQLWEDGKCIAQENVDVALPSLDSYKYTFTQRVDCSDPTNHEFEIRNVTPGDEKLCAQSIYFNVDNTVSESVDSSYSETCNYNYIKEVKFGTVDVKSEGTNYSDYSDQIATITPGDSLTLEIVPSSMYAYTNAWVDWNEDNTFSEDERVSLVAADTSYVGTLVIPQNKGITEGLKPLRIVSSYDTQKATGQYSYGETEDYSIEVARKQGAPALVCNVDTIDETLDAGNVARDINISNTGAEALTGDFTVEYQLDGYPSSYRPTSAIATTDAPKMIKARIADAKRGAMPKAGADTKYTLRYDKGDYATIGITNSDTATYANVYPGKMLSNLKGMQLSSVDVYVGDVAGSNSIVVYGQGSQTSAGAVLSEQSFQPVDHAWNHVQLDKPVIIGDEDLWIGYKTAGFAENKYYVGIDEGPAVRGFGDVINIGGNYWWSMGDLGYDEDYCIRGNVTGEPTPAISWLTLSDSKISVDNAASADVKASLDGTSLEQNKLYSAIIKIETNDDLVGRKEIPVYVHKGELNAIEEVSNDQSTISMRANSIAVSSNKTVKGLSLIATTGQLFKRSRGNIIRTNGLHGIYLLQIDYADGTKSARKVLLR